MGWGTKFKAKANTGPKKGPRASDSMNKAEQAYALHLESLKQKGLIHDHRFHAQTIRVSVNCRYEPDFLVIMPDGAIRIIDVKAKWKSGVHIEDDALVKMKACAELYPYFSFEAVWWDKDKGLWDYRQF